MTKLWQALEDAPILMEVASVWRERLGMEFESLQRLLTTTNSIATSIRFPGDRSNWRVIDEGERIIAVNPEMANYRVIHRSDALLQRFDVRTFGTELCDALRWTSRFEMIGSTYHVCRVGVLPASLNSIPAYLCIRRYSADLLDAIDSVARHAIGPYLLLTPTNRVINAATHAWLARTEGRTIALDQVLKIDLNKPTVKFASARDSTTNLQRLLGIEVTESPKYQFKLLGSKHRYIAYDSEPTIVLESPGMFYIAILLAQPNKSLHVTQLQAMRTGINALVSQGSLGTKIDSQAKREYATRLNEIEQEIETGGDFVSEERLETLYAEKEAIIEAVRAATQKHGELRGDSDADRSRQAVCTAIRRAIKAIGNEHKPLGDYLDRTIGLGFEVRYDPPRTLDWQF